MRRLIKWKITEVRDLYLEYLRPENIVKPPTNHAAIAPDKESVFLFSPPFESFVANAKDKMAHDTSSGHDISQY